MTQQRHGATPIGRLLAVIGIAATVALTGCTGTGTDPNPTSELATVGPDADGAASAAPVPASAPPSASPPAVPRDEEAAVDVSAGTDTTALAVAAVTAFCQPTLTGQEWIGQLYPFLSQSAALAYESVDPGQVPCTAVTGDGRVRDGDEAFTIRILVPTDAGEYSVYVHRPTVDAGWAVEQITPMSGQ